MGWNEKNMAEEMLDGALAKQCNNFQPEIYSKLQVLNNIVVTENLFLSKLF